jgi:NADH-quinone oxidoreductase subunit J
MTLNLILFLALAAIAVLSALGMLLSRNAIYAVLYLIVNFASVAVLYLLLHAPFIAIVQVTVYAGAIMVLFLFVIMLLSAEHTGRTDSLFKRQPLVFVLGAALLAEVVYIVYTQKDTLPNVQSITDVFGSPKAIGELLFSQYLLPFEITSILLLAAMIGAVVLTKSEKK